MSQGQFPCQRRNRARRRRALGGERRPLLEHGARALERVGDCEQRVAFGQRREALVQRLEAQQPERRAVEVAMRTYGGRERRASRRCDLT